MVLDVKLEPGQVWVDVEYKHVFRITTLQDDIVYYVIIGSGIFRGPYPTSRIQWELDVEMGRLVKGEVPSG